MQFFNVLCKDKERGFTLLEIAIVIAIIGILGAIVTPSFINIYNVNKVNEAIDKAKGAIQEAQNQAIRYSQRCRIQILNVGENDLNGVTNTSTDPIIKALPPATPPTASASKEESCLVNDTRILSGIKLEKTRTTWVISFDSKGRTDANSNATMVLSIPNVPQPRKCIAVSDGLGLIRSGEAVGMNCNTTR